MNVSSVNGKDYLYCQTQNQKSVEGSLPENLQTEANTQENVQIPAKSEPQSGVIYEKSSPYAAAGVPDASIMEIKSNQEVQVHLSNLGFYSGSYGGDLTSSSSIKAIKDFQRVYGLSVTGSVTNAMKNKLEQASKMKSDILASQDFQDMARTKLYLDSQEKDALAKTWAFLRVGMGLTTNQAAGVCGNLHAESHFSADNAEDTKYPGYHNTNYVYDAGDKVGYGLMQWTAENLKTGLKNMANTMGLSVSNLNVQLAFFREDVLNIRSSAWNKVIANDTYYHVSDAFHDNMEISGTKNYAERRNYSYQILNTLYLF